MSLSKELMPMNQISIWENEITLKEIKEVYGRDLTDTEFKLLVQTGIATGLNPFLKEIWAVKGYKNKEGKYFPAQIFIGRDGYRKSAQRSPEYDYHTVDAVYSNDKFAVKDGEPIHQYDLTNRGTLLGAYCVVKRRSSSKPMFNFVELQEYSTGKSLWREAKDGGKKATMIKKVAEAQGLRGAYQEVFINTYHEYEDWKDDNNYKPLPQNKYSNRIANKANITDTLNNKNVMEGVVVNIPVNSVELNDELDEACLLLTKSENTEELKNVFSKYWKVFTDKKDMASRNYLQTKYNKIKDEIGMKEFTKEIEDAEKCDVLTGEIVK